MKEKTRTILYGTFVTMMVIFLYIAYANVVTELKIEGEGDAKEQEGVYIANVEYLTNNEADKDNSKINYTLGTMLDSKIVLGSSTSSSITYQVTIKNNTDREQVFIGIIKDETNEGAYNNTSIQPNVGTAGEITGLEEYVSTVAPGEYITFPVTYAYAGTDTSNNELQGKINFRFREKPILELSNNGETYTLENIYAGYTPAEYEFTVSNYNETYTNGVPLTYSFETILTEGSPLTAKIYDSEGNEVTESITIAGDNNTYEDHTYTLKIEWDSSLDSTEYEGKSYTCTVDLTAIPDTTVDADLADYGDYKIEQGFEIEITTCSHTWENGVCTICGKICEHEEYGEWETVTAATCGAEGLEKRTCSICKNEETQSIEATGNHTYGAWETTKEATCVDKGEQTRTCSVCGDKQTQEIPATGEHNVVNGKCTVCGEVFNTAPEIATNTLNGKTATSITINATATDADGDTLTYKLYTSTSQNGSYILNQTSSATAQNTQVTLTASSLSNYLTYWWYITVTDGTETVTSSKQSVKTYCPGTGFTCSSAETCPGTTASSTCSSCSGSGQCAGSATWSSQLLLSRVLDRTLLA